METIVTSVLAKYFRLFIKDFKNDQFKLSLLKGSAHLSNLRLNEAFIQEMMMIPTNLEVQSASCNELTVSLPNVTKLAESPVVMSIDRINMALREPVIIPPMPTTMSPPNALSSEPSTPSTPNVSDADGKKKKKKKKKLNFEDTVMNMTFKVNEVHLEISTLPREDAGGWVPQLVIDIRDVVIQSTNSSWEVVKLSAANDVDKKQALKRTYKQLTCQSLSVNLIQLDGSPMSLVKRIPAEIRVAACLNTDMDEYTAITVDMLFEEINFSANELSWQMIAQLFSSIKRCFERDAPKNPEAEAIASARVQEGLNKLSTLEIMYNLHIERWSLEFHKTSLVSGAPKDGFTFHGFGFHFYISPRKQLKSAQDGDGDELYESVLKLNLHNMTLRQLSPPRDRDARYTKLLGQAVPDNASGETPRDFLDVTILHRWARIDDPRSTIFSVNLNGLQVVLDRFAWKGLYHFLSGAIVTPSGAGAGAAAAATTTPPPTPANDDATPPAAASSDGGSASEEPKLSPKEMAEWINKMHAKKVSDYFKWYHSSRVDINVNNTVLLIPKDRYADEDGFYLSQALHLMVRQVGLTNRPDWSLVPFLFDGLASLPASDYLSFSQQASELSNKFQMSLVDATIETVDSMDGDATPATILRPSTIRLYGRLLETPNDEAQRPQLELAIHAGDFCFTLTEPQEEYFKKIWPTFRKWHAELQISDQEKDKFKQTLEDVALTAALTVSEAKTTEILEKAKHDTISAVDAALKTFQCAVIFRADNGIFRIPLYNIGTTYEPRNAIDSPLHDGFSNNRSLLSQLTFSGLTLIVENSPTRQSVLARLMRLQADELDHPRSPTSLRLVPLPVTGSSSVLLDDAHCHHLQFCCQRILPVDTPSFTEISVRLQGMQVCAKAKKGGLNELEDVMPDLQVIAKKITDTLIGMQGSKDDIRRGMEMAGQAVDVLDLSWEFEIADCELVLHDSSNKKRPFGVIKISTFNRQALTKQFETLEGELITTKMLLANTEANTDSFKSQLTDLRAEMARMQAEADAKVQRAKEEAEHAMQQLIATKMLLAEQQGQYDELARKLRGGK